MATEGTEITQEQWRASYDTLCAVLEWMDEQKAEGEEFPSQMEPRLIKTAGRVQDQLDDIPLTINHDTSEVLYDDG